MQPQPTTLTTHVFLYEWDDDDHFSPVYGPLTVSIWASFGDLNVQSFRTSAALLMFVAVVNNVLLINLLAGPVRIRGAMAAVMPAIFYLCHSPGFEGCASRNEIKMAMKSIQSLHVLTSTKPMISSPLHDEICEQIHSFFRPLR